MNFPRPLFILFLTAFLTNMYAQTTLYFQGFENTALTCSENWGYTGGVRNTETARTGTNSARIGRSSESNTITMSTINTTGLTNLQVQIYHSVRTGSGPGMDTREGALFLVSLNGGAYTVISGVRGNSDYGYAWSATSGGITNTCPVTYTTPNPLTYNVPAGTTSISIRAISIGRNSSTCAAFSTAMSGSTAYSFDRSDEGFFIDDVRLVTNSAITNVTWNGSVSNSWFCQGNWTPPVVPTPAINATFSTDNAVSQRDIVLVTGPVAECNDLSITGGANNDFSIKGENGATKTLRVYGNLNLNGQDGLDFSDGTTGTPDGTIELKGNWDNQVGEANFKQGESTLILNGTINQNITVTGAGPEIFYNLTVNKTAGDVLLNDPVEVCGNSTDPLADRAGVLTLTGANIVTGGSYIYAVNPAAGAVSGGSANSFVDGNFRRQTNSANLYDFPCGEGTRFMRAGIRPTGTGVNVIEIDANNTGYGIYTPLESSINNVSTARWWDVSRISGSTPVNVRLYWINPATDGITAVSDLVVAHYSTYDHAGSSSTLQWWDRGRNAANSSALITNGYAEASEAVNTFSPFTLATLTPSNPLPVELSSFEVSCADEGYVSASWSTSSEINNRNFEFQGSANGTGYTALHLVNGQGNSNILHTYSAQVPHIHHYRYFRLAQFDYDGTATYYTPVFLTCETGNNTFQASCHGELINIRFPENITGEVSLSIIDITGKTLCVQQLQGQETQVQLTFYEKPGIYIVTAVEVATGKMYTARIVKY